MASRLRGEVKSVALRMKNEELVERVGEPSLPRENPGKNNPSTLVITKLNRGEREIFTRD